MANNKYIYFKSDMGFAVYKSIGENTRTLTNVVKIAEMLPLRSILIKKRYITAYTEYYINKYSVNINEIYGK